MGRNFLKTKQKLMRNTCKSSCNLKLLFYPQFTIATSDSAVSTVRPLRSDRSRPHDLHSCTPWLSNWSQKRVKSCFPIVTAYQAQMQSVNVKTKKTFSPFNLNNTHVTIPSLRLHTRIHIQKTHTHPHNHDVYMKQKHHKTQCHYTLTHTQRCLRTFFVRNVLFVFITVPFVKEHSYVFIYNLSYITIWTKTHTLTHTLETCTYRYTFFLFSCWFKWKHTHTHTSKQTSIKPEEEIFIANLS